MEVEVHNWKLVMLTSEIVLLTIPYLNSTAETLSLKGRVYSSLLKTISERSRVPLGAKLWAEKEKVTSLYNKYAPTQFHPS